MDHCQGGQPRSIFAELADDWTRLCRRTPLARQVRRWAEAEPALAAAASPHDLLARIDHADQSVTDDMLIALIRLTQDGQQLAGRVLLQAMLPKLARISRSFRQAHGADLRAPRERQHLAVAAFWEVLHSYPAGRRHRTVAGNLALETLHLLTQDLRKQAPDLPLDLEDEPDLHSHNVVGVAESTQPGVQDVGSGITAEADLIDVVTWGVEVHAITGEEAALLVRVYLPDPALAGSAAIAEHLGTTPAAVRQRCSRARRRLIDAVRADAEGRPVATIAAAA